MLYKCDCIGFSRTTHSPSVLTGNFVDLLSRDYNLPIERDPEQPIRHRTQMPEHNQRLASHPKLENLTSELITPNELNQRV